MNMRNDFTGESLELNLFFLRIMREHAFFLENAFLPNNEKMAGEARKYTYEFERLLMEAVLLANGNVSRAALDSEQFVTRYTDDAERLTSFYTGKAFNLNLTQRELRLLPGNGTTPETERRTEMLNHRAYRLTAAFADFKSTLYQRATGCEIFILNYPSLVRHMREEAEHYMEQLGALTDMNAGPASELSEEAFWNARMAEHAKTVAGMLDPSEDTLIGIARMFGEEFSDLEAETKAALAGEGDSTAVTADSLDATERLRAFKTAAVEGLLQCKIQSVILPLLADHILREANHYLFAMGK